MRINIRNHEELNDLPSRVANTLFQDYNKEFRDGIVWRARRRPWHKIGHYYPYKIVERICESHIGKPFDEAFSKYCKMVPVYQQHYFLEEFSPKYFHWRNDYFVDENGLIQANRDKNKYKGPYTFYSADYKTEERHIVTGKLKPEERWWSIKKYKVDDSLYEKVVVSGFSETFDSKNDRKYKRLTNEKNKAVEREWKAKKKLPSINDQDFRRILKEKELKERQENLIKILKHGFDPVTSFRKHKKED